MYRRIVLPDSDVMPKLHTTVKGGEHVIFADGYSSTLCR